MDHDGQCSCPFRHGLVSGLYSAAPSPPWTREESDRRLRLLVRRLIVRHGVDDVVRRVRARVSDAELRVRLIVLAEAAGRGLNGAIG